MYVCNCHGLSDRDIRELRDQGLTKTLDIFKGLGINRPQCGKCVNMTRAILAGNDGASCDHRFCIQAKARGCSKALRRVG